MPAISIIIPVYNAEMYLYRCIDSIFAQTFTDFELLLIDDGSIDKSGAICDEYVARDSRVRVFHKENCGVSCARNFGLDNAQGKWIAFVDADDWLETTALEKMLETADADLIIGSVKFHPSGTKGNLLNENKRVARENLNELLINQIDHYSISGPWAKLYKTKIIENNKLRFDTSLCFGEDSLFVKEYLLHTNSIRCINDLCYNYQNIDDNIYKKYSKSFSPILKYYWGMCTMYERIWKTRGILVSKEGVINVVYEIAKICAKQNFFRDKADILAFYRDIYVIEALSKRNSKSIKIELILAKLPFGFLFYIYIQGVSYLKSFFNLNNSYENTIYK